MKTNESPYVALAKNSIHSAFLNTTVDLGPVYEQNPELSVSGASFVTLTINGSLRGCIGSIIPHRKLGEDIVLNARSAAFSDPRFLPLTYEEYPFVHVEVSILTLPKKVEYRDRSQLREIIRPHIDGVILKLGNRQATFLPQVWDELDDFEMFFSHLGLKAGIGSDPLSYNPEIFTYQVDKYE